MPKATRNLGLGPKTLRARFLASLSRKSRHSRESGNPLRPDQQWAPAFAGATTFVIFILLDEGLIGLGDLNLTWCGGQIVV